jgi:hypothetical protein
MAESDDTSRRGQKVGVLKSIYQSGARRRPASARGQQEAREPW